MKTRKTKPGNKDFQRMIQTLGFDLMNMRMQINALGGMFADFVEFTGKKDAFLKHMEELEAEREATESIKDSKSTQKVLD
jgi:hypothetical protein